MHLDPFYLNNNQLTSLPESIGNITYLQSLVLSNNQLSTLPESIGKFVYLQKLDLENNPLIALPESIFKLYIPLQNSTRKYASFFRIKLNVKDKAKKR